MKHFILTVATGLALVTSGAQAMDIAGFKKVATEIVQEAASGNVSDIDALIAKNEVLVQIGIVGCKEYRTQAPEHAKLMTMVLDNVENMRNMTLEEIESAWHEGEYMSANGLDFDSIDHFGAALSHMDAVLHPITAILALKEYKETRDSDLIDQVKDEIGEVLKHIEHVDA